MIRHLGFIGFEIDEYAGSEGGVGYAWLRAAVSSCEQITVFTRGDLSDAALDSILALPNVSVFLIPPPFFINKKLKPAILEVGVFRLALNLGYRIWLSRVARQLVGKNEQFSLIHYCTYVGYRFKTGLEGGGCPIVRGPIGGLENSKLDAALSSGLWTFLALVFRNVANLYDLKFSREARIAMTGSAVRRAISAHPGIQSVLLQRFGVASSCFIENPAVFVPDIYPASKRILNCVVVWNGSSQKRVGLVAWAVLLAACNIHLDVFGPELKPEHLPCKARRLFSKSKIRCHGYVDRRQLIDFLRSSTFFATFSLKDLSSVSLIEAMSVGAIPVVTDDNGFKYLANHKRAIVCKSKAGFALAREAANGFESLADSEWLRDYIHGLNSRWMADNYSQEKLVVFLKDQYRAALKHE